MAKILLLGATGQVGRELQRSLAILGSVVAVGRRQVDLADTARLRDLVRGAGCDVLVNAAAHTAVDAAEADSALAFRINAEAVAVLAAEAVRTGALLVHYSTDYVFDGTKADAYTELDEPAPLNVYGRSKLAGDAAIVASRCRHLILRTSWVYGRHGVNFVETILRLARERDTLDVVCDQHGAPTSAELLADVTALCVALKTRYPQQYACGIYNVAPAGDVSRHACARYVVQAAAENALPLRLHPAHVRAIASADHAAAARRPANSRLATAKLRETFGVTMPDWRLHLDRYIQQAAAAAAR